MASFAKYAPPAPPAPPECPGCRVMIPDVLVPAEARGLSGDPIGYCWLCAHLITEHDEDVTPATLAAALTTCTCDRSTIYPERAPLVEPTCPQLAPEPIARNVENVLELDREIIATRGKLNALENRRRAAAPLRYARVPASVRQAQARTARAVGGATAAARRAAGR